MNGVFRFRKPRLFNTDCMNSNIYRIHAKSALFMLFVFAAIAPTIAAETTPSKQLQYWTDKAGSQANSERGKVFFNSTHGKEWSCSSCHGNPPSSLGKHASTSKAIDPLAPSVNPDALTDSARTDKWFRRNCNDVLGRECLAQEKADVLSYLISIKK
jgi:hypothetical protein